MSDSPASSPQLPAAQTHAAPPHPLDGNWHVHIGEQTYGPYTGHQIKEYAGEGRILPNSRVLLVGTETWMQAKDDRALGQIFGGQLKAPPPINATSGSTVVQITNQMAQPSALLALELANAKSPGLALILSFFICGVGQMYNGQVAKGILMFIGCIVLWVVFLGWTIWLWSIIDAYQTAKRLNLLRAQQIAAGLVA